jgi:hypothetical protein
VFRLQRLPDTTHVHKPYGISFFAFAALLSSSLLSLLINHEAWQSTAKKA